MRDKGNSYILQLYKMAMLEERKTLNREASYEDYKYSY